MFEPDGACRAGENTGPKPGPWADGELVTLGLRPGGRDMGVDDACGEADSVGNCAGLWEGVVVAAWGSLHGEVDCSVDDDSRFVI